MSKCKNETFIESLTAKNQMKQEISVKKAINRGHLMVNIPVFICIIGFPAITIYLSRKGIIPGWGIVIGSLIGFAISWFIWSFMITKWRIWAFENVRNVHELKKRAIEQKLLWKDGSVFEKTEIKSHRDKLKLKKLEDKFEKEDVYREDYFLASRTEIFYSKLTNRFELTISILIVGIGIYLITLSTKQGYFFRKYFDIDRFV